jgi:signal transduction histidine kinase
MDFLGLANLRYLDFASIFIYGHLPQNKLEELFALFITIAWFGFLGIVFTYITRREHLILRGLVFGIGIWFSAYAVTLLFDVPELANIPLGTAFTNFIGSAIFGSVLGFMVRWFKNRYEVK